MKKILINTIKLTITTILTILAIKYARIERGYNAFGGETLIPPLCWIILFLAPKMAKECRKSKGGNENEIR